MIEGNFLPDIHLTPNSTLFIVAYTSKPGRTTPGRTQRRCEDISAAMWQDEQSLDSRTLKVHINTAERQVGTDLARGLRQALS